MMRKLAVLTLALSFLAAGASAQMPGSASSRPLRLVISGGLTVPTGDFESMHDLGYHAERRSS